MSSNVSKCPQMFLKCLQMSSDVLKCLKMSSDIFKCLQMSSDVSKCLQMSSDVFKCLQISSDVFKCLQIYFLFKNKQVFQKITKLINQNHACFDKLDQCEFFRSAFFYVVISSLLSRCRPPRRASRSSDNARF